MASLSLASGLSDSQHGFPPAVVGVFSGSIPAPLGLGGELNMLLELFSLCCEEPTSPREVLDLLEILSLALPLGGHSGGMLVGRGCSFAAQWTVSLRILVEQVTAPVSDWRLHVPLCFMAWLGCPLGFAWGDIDGALW